MTRTNSGSAHLYEARRQASQGEAPLGPQPTALAAPERRCCRTVEAADEVSVAWSMRKSTRQKQAGLPEHGPRQTRNLNKRLSPEVVLLLR